MWKGVEDYSKGYKNNIIYSQLKVACTNLHVEATSQKSWMVKHYPLLIDKEWKTSQIHMYCQYFLFFLNFLCIVSTWTRPSLSNWYIFLKKLLWQNHHIFLRFSIFMHSKSVPVSTKKYTLLWVYISSYSQLVGPTQLWVGGSIHP